MVFKMTQRKDVPKILFLVHRAEVCSQGKVEKGSLGGSIPPPNVKKVFISFVEPDNLNFISFCCQTVFLN